MNFSKHTDDTGIIYYEKPCIIIYNAVGIYNHEREPVYMEELIIGETEDTYVREFFLSRQTMWKDGFQIDPIHNLHLEVSWEIIVLGIHKSRFVKFKSTQLNLF